MHPKVYFYSAVNGYGSKPPYGCKIEWSWWKMGTEIIEWASWCHTGLSFLLFSMSWLGKYTRSFWDRETLTAWVHEGATCFNRRVSASRLVVGRLFFSNIYCFVLTFSSGSHNVMILQKEDIVLWTRTMWRFCSFTTKVLCVRQHHKCPCSCNVVRLLFKVKHGQQV